MHDVGKTNPRREGVRNPSFWSQGERSPHQHFYAQIIPLEEVYSSLYTEDIEYPELSYLLCLPEKFASSY
jgi:hypothetical protein